MRDLKPGECAHGMHQCVDWPEPDMHGRRRCVACRCFTAREVRGVWRHLWCEPKSGGRR